MGDQLHIVVCGSIHTRVRGLDDRQAEAGRRLDVLGGGRPFPIAGRASAELERTTVEQIRDRLIAGGVATADDIDTHLAHVASGDLGLATSPMVTARGQRPAS
jgi:hypothetical protein